MAWAGYRQSRVAGGGAMNGHVAPKAKQQWVVGNVVNVGFLRFTVTGKDGAAWVLQSLEGRVYRFVPHEGLTADE